MPVLGDFFENANSAEEYVDNYKDHFATMVRDMDTAAVAEVIAVLEAAAADHRTVFLIGNGGAAAVAKHWVNDLGVNSVVAGHPGYRVVSLADNTSAITAVANDIAFEEIFVAQLKSAMHPGDIVIAMSVSGNSPNLIQGLEYAKEHGAHTIAFTGMGGGKLRKIADLVVHTPSSTDEYGPVEDMFSAFMHIATGYLTMKRGRHLHH